MLNFLKKILSQPTIHSTSSGLTDVGKVRTNNEDCFAIFAEKNICVVADGMGGHNGGDIASQMAVEYIPKYYFPKIHAEKKVEDFLEQGILDVVQ